MIETSLTIVNKLGLHARAANKLVQCCQSFEAEITLRSSDSDTFSDAKSIMALMILALSKGSKIVVRAQGSDEQQAIDAISHLVNDYFGEGE